MALGLRRTWDGKEEIQAGRDCCEAASGGCPDVARSECARSEGVHPADINRRAPAIECYLDLALEGYPPAKVVWTNFKPELDTYHGALEHKDAYTKLFLKQTPETLAAGGYGASKILAVLDAIVAECRAIALDVASATG